MERKVDQLVTFDRQKNIVSSANMVNRGGGEFLATLIPCNEPFACVWIHSPERASVQRMNRYGDRGSPCLSPRDGKTRP